MISHLRHSDPHWTLGLESVRSEASSARVTRVYGRLPESLRGTFYRNGPGRHDLGGRRLSHWFDGDGMVQAFLFTDHGISHHGRFVDTAKHMLENETGQFVYAGFGTRFRGARLLDDPEGLNTANTNILPHHGRLLALWEGGPAHALDAETLETEGTVCWADGLDGQPFSAHPSIEPDGTLWNFGINARSRQLVLYEIAPDGRLRRSGTINLPAAPMVHDFAVTERRLVFLLPPFNFQGARLKMGASILGSFAWQPRKGLRVLVIDKADFARCWWAELPTGFVFHMGGAWDDGGCVRVDYERYPDPTVVRKFARRVMCGRTTAFHPPKTTQLVFDLANGRAHEETLATDSEFPELHPDHVGRRYRFRYSAAASTPRNHPFQNAVRRLDLETGEIAQYVFGPDTIAEEHVAVPKPYESGETAAWLVGTVLDLAAGATNLTVFDAARVGDGPVYRAVLDRPLPMGFHGNFLPGS